MWSQRILLFLALPVLAYMGWSGYAYVAGSIPAFEFRFRAAIAAMILFVLFYAFRTYRLHREDIKPQGGTVRGRLALSLYSLLDDVARSEAKATKLQINILQSDRRELLMAWRKLAKAQAHRLPSEHKPRTSIDEMSIAEVIRFGNAANSLQAMQLVGVVETAPKVKRLKGVKATSSESTDGSNTDGPVKDSLLELVRILVSSEALEAKPDAEKLSTLALIALLRDRTLAAQKSKEAEARARQEEKATAERAIGDLTRRHEAELRNRDKNQRKASDRINELQTQNGDLDRQLKEANRNNTQLGDTNRELRRNFEAQGNALGAANRRLQAVTDEQSGISSASAALLVQVQDLTSRLSNSQRWYARRRQIALDRRLKLADLRRITDELGLRAERCDSAEAAAHAEKLRADEASARADSLQAKLNDVPPFAGNIRQQVRATLASADSFVAFLTGLNADTAQLDQAMFALLTLEGGAARIAEISNELDARVESLGPDCEEKAALEASKPRELVLHFVVEAVSRIGLSFLDVLDRDSIHRTPIALDLKLACAMLGNSLSSREKWRRFRDTNSGRMRVLDSIPASIRLGLALTSEDPRDLVFLLLGTTKIRNACYKARLLSNLHDGALRQYHGLQGNLRCASSSIQDPLGLRRLRWIVRATTSEEHRKVFRLGMEDLNLLYTLTPAHWKVLLETIYPSDETDAPISRAELEQMLGYDPRYILALLDTRAETLEEYGVEEYLEPWLTMARLEPRANKSSLGPLSEAIEAFVFDGINGKHRDVIKTRRGYLETFLNRCDTLARAAG